MFPFRLAAAALLLPGLLAAQPAAAQVKGDPAQDFLRVALQFCLQSLGEPEVMVAKLEKAGAVESGPGDWSEGVRRFGASLNGRPFDVIASRSGGCAAAAPEIDVLAIAPDVGQMLESIEGVVCREAWGKSDPDYGPAGVVGRRFCAWQGGGAGEAVAAGQPVVWLQYTQDPGEKGLALAEFGALPADLVRDRLESETLFQEMWRK